LSKAQADKNVENIDRWRKLQEHAEKEMRYIEEHQNSKQTGSGSNGTTDYRSGSKNTKQTTSTGSNAGVFLCPF
jgi:hypothetical protein